MSDDSLKPTVKTAIEARQGVTGHNVRYVLAWSTSGAVVVMALLYFMALHHGVSS